jgi:hypothetical protein
MRILILMQILDISAVRMQSGMNWLKIIPSDEVWTRRFEFHNQM